jgi:hypothetical protein
MMIDDDPWAYSHNYALGNWHILCVMNLLVPIFVDTCSHTMQLIFVSLKLTHVVSTSFLHIIISYS